MGGGVWKWKTFTKHCKVVSTLSDDCIHKGSYCDPVMCHLVCTHVFVVVVNSFIYLRRKKRKEQEVGWEIQIWRGRFSAK